MHGLFAHFVLLLCSKQMNHWILMRVKFRLVPITTIQLHTQEALTGIAEDDVLCCHLHKANIMRIALRGLSQINSYQLTVFHSLENLFPSQWPLIYYVHF